MDVILENVKALWPFLAVAWLVVIIATAWKPQRYFNSILLMVACFVTMLFVAGLFGDYMSTALLIMFLLVMAALFLVPVMLMANGVEMIKREGASLPHLLSMILGIGVGIGEIAAVIFVLGSTGEVVNLRMHLFALWITVSVFYFSCLVLNFVLYSVFMQLMPHRMSFDYVIIHGCSLKNGEKLTRLLQNRVDKAIEIYRKCKKKPILIPSGGKGSDEAISEAAAMKAYLLEQGIPEEHILMEDQSANTYENLVNSRKLIEEREGEKRTALVSTNYHIYRCLCYAKKIGMKCVGIGAKVRFYYWPSALIREFIAIFQTKKFLIWALIGYLVFVGPFAAMMFYR